MLSLRLLKINKIMTDSQIKARALILEFMQPIDPLNKYPMCFDTARQCAVIATNKILETIPYINNTDKQCIDRMYYIELIQDIRDV
jgi:hypothetical protein